MAAFDFVFILFFLASFLCGVVFDSAIIIKDPTINGIQYEWPLPEVQAMLDQWIAEYDPVLGNPPLFLRAAAYMELAFQLPFYFVAIYAFLFKRNWIRVPTLMYCAHTLTVVSCYAMEATYGGYELKHPKELACTYGIWVVFPVLLLLRCRNADMFGNLKIKMKAATKRD